MKKRFLLFIFLLSCHIPYAQHRTYNQLWMNGAYQFKKEKFNFRFDGSYRNMDWFQFTRQYVLREITSYNFNKHFQLGAGPCLSWQYPYYEVKPIFEFRPTFHFNAKTNISSNKYVDGKFENNKTEISIRLRWELRYFDLSSGWSKTFHRPRIMLRSSIPLSNTISLIPYAEILWQKNPGLKYKYSAGRLFLAVNFLYKKINYQIGYMFQHVEQGTTDEIDNNYQITLSN